MTSREYEKHKACAPWLITNQRTHAHHVVQTLSLVSSAWSSELSASASARFSPITCLISSVSFVLSFTHWRSCKETSTKKNNINTKKMKNRHNRFRPESNVPFKLKKFLTLRMKAASSLRRRTLRTQLHFYCKTYQLNYNPSRQTGEIWKRRVVVFVRTENNLKTQVFDNDRVA